MEVETAPLIVMLCRGKPAKAEPAASEDLTEESPCVPMFRARFPLKGSSWMLMEAMLAQEFVGAVPPEQVDSGFFSR